MCSRLSEKQATRAAECVVDAQAAPIDFEDARLHRRQKAIWIAREACYSLFILCSPKLQSRVVVVVAVIAREFVRPAGYSLATLFDSSENSRFVCCDR